MQPYPAIPPRTFFPSFDYIEKSYADYLDSLAIIFILWSSSSILVQCIQTIHGRNTKSLAFKDLSDRLIFMKVAKLWKNKSSKLPWSNASFRLWFSAVVTFLLLLGVDALVVYSQTSAHYSRKLDSLKLHQLTLNSLTSNKPVDGGYGCLPMVRRLATSDTIPLYYCTEGFTMKIPENIPPGKQEIYFEVYDDRFYRISIPRENDYSIVQISVQLHDNRNSIVHYANLTAWRFELSVERLKPLADKIEEKFPFCRPKTLHHGKGVLKISLDAEHWNLSLSVFASDTGIQMVDLSTSLIESRDFIGFNGTKETSSQSIFTSTSSESVKRLSGIILWIIAGILEFFRLLSSRALWDINAELDGMMADILDLPRSELLKFSPSISFEVIEHPRIENEDEANTNSNDRGPISLFLRRKA